MRLTYEPQNRSNEQTLKYIYYAITALILTLVHILALDFISVGGITPDLLLILAIWIAISEGQFVGLYAGFAIGLTFDLFTADIPGTNALSKTIAAFIAGYFWKEGKRDKTIGNLGFLAIMFGISIIHNLIYFFFYIKASDISYFGFFMKYGMAMSFYTTVFSIFPMLFKIRSSRM
jgi:rod shape-determining protein MreD